MMMENPRSFRPNICGHIKSLYLHILRGGSTLGENGTTESILRIFEGLSNDHKPY